jgi:hypothetical protein
MFFALTQQQYVHSGDRKCNSITSAASSSTATTKSYGRQVGRPVTLGRILNADHTEPTVSDVYCHSNTVIAGSDNSWVWIYVDVVQCRFGIAKANSFSKEPHQMTAKYT